MLQAPGFFPTSQEWWPGNGHSTAHFTDYGLTLEVQSLREMGGESIKGQQLRQVLTFKKWLPWEGEIG